MILWVVLSIVNRQSSLFAHDGVSCPAGHLEAAAELHARVPPGSAARALVEGEDAERGQKFVLKRMFSEGGIGLAIITFLSLLLEVRD